MKPEFSIDACKSLARIDLRASFVTILTIWPYSCEAFTRSGRIAQVFLPSPKKLAMAPNAWRP
ncbi:hypothetical protein NITHO_2380002 [Nitrolancea hollandica Lb]|uniref:Uncharacterized protein n=1 Tax=Nitrolancea hollandica Lb TaxID=1129897 RepID=I4EFR1_9BACT|nr:hypothetical protein NITHO_2380002 [Nitrolancea hollandica Lb]